MSASPTPAPFPAARDIEWPTLLIMGLTYLVWGLATTALWGLSPLLAIVVTGLCITQFSSLQHEVLHGHPFRSTALNAALVWPALTLTVPYGRFRDTHLAHHYDPNLTDPYDDPESNYCDPAVWGRMAPPLRAMLRINNTLLGRMMLGPIIGNALWLSGEARLVRAGDRAVRRDWLLHLAGLVPVVAWLWVAPMTGWGYLAAAYLGHALLKIRTYLEHRAHIHARSRTVVVEDRGPLALLFLNNNYHSVHHSHPSVPWYRLPALFRANRSHFLRRNDGYYFASYLPVFRDYLLRQKDPVAHPVWPVVKSADLEDAAKDRHVA
ncbi:MAG: fatty acid desaturase [Pseudomonadota bacterium]